MWACSLSAVRRQVRQPACRLPSLIARHGRPLHSSGAARAVESKSEESVLAGAAADANAGTHQLYSWPTALSNRVFNTVPDGMQAVVERGWSGKESFSKVVVGGGDTGKFTALPLIDQIPFVVDTREAEVKLPVLRCVATDGEVLEVMSSMRVQFVDGPGADENMQERAVYKAAYGRPEPAVFNRINEATSNPYMAVVFAAWEHLLVELKSTQASAVGDPALRKALQDQAHAKMAALGAEWGLAVNGFSIDGVENAGVADDSAAQLEAYLNSRKNNKAQVAADETRKAKKVEAEESAAKAAAEAAEAERVAALDAEERAKAEAEAAKAAEAEAAQAAAEEAVALAEKEKQASTEAAAAAEALSHMEVEVPEAVKSKVETLRSVLKVSEEEGLEGVVAIEDFNLALEMVGIDVSEMADLVKKHTAAGGESGVPSVNYTALLDEAEATSN